MEQFPRIDVLPGMEILRKAGKAVVNLFCMHQLASHGEHFVHPFDEPLAPVIELPHNEPRTPEH